MNQHRAALAQATSVLVAGSLAGVLAKMALRDIAPFTFVWLQLGIGGCLLTLYTFALRREPFPKALDRKVWAAIVLMGIGNFTLVRVLFILALDRLPATTNAYLINFVGIVTMGMSILVLREHPTLLQVLGAAVAILGLRVFFKEIPPPTERIGVLYVAIAVLALAATNTIARKLVTAGSKASTLMISTVALWAGGLPVVLAGLAFDWPPVVTGWTNWSIIVLNAVVSISVGTAVWILILRSLRSYEASILAATSVVYTAVFAVPILGERLALHQVTGIAFMLLGVSLVQFRQLPWRRHSERNAKPA